MQKLNRAITAILVIGVSALMLPALVMPSLARFGLVCVEDFLMFLSGGRSLTARACLSANHAKSVRLRLLNSPGLRATVRVIAEVATEIANG